MLGEMTWPNAPMKASPGPLPRGDDWMFEPKWDGHRALVRVRGNGQVDAVSSTGKPRIEQWPWLEALAATLNAPGGGDWILDGEVIAVDESGKHSFQLVGRPDCPHAFVAFDLLMADGVDIAALAWHERRARLEQALSPTPTILLTPVADDGDAMMQVTHAGGFEGVIAKRRLSTYQAGRRSPSWVKVKHRHEQELVVGGYLVGRGNRAATFGSLLVGVYDGPTLRFAGGVGTGFDERLLRTLKRQLDDLVVDDSPFDPAPELQRGTARWVRPELVAQVSFAEWTETGHLRHPVFVGLRDDKSARDVVRET